MAVLSKEIYSPQNFLETLTGEGYIIGDYPIETIYEILIQKNIVDATDNTVWDYSLDEIDEIVTNNITVILVDVSGFNEDDEWVKEYRWFKIPASYCDNFKKD